MEWNLYSFDKKTVNYEDLSKNPLIATGVKNNPNISDNLKINGKIYHICMIDLENHYAGVHEVTFKKGLDLQESIDEDFICPYCGYVYNDAFELDDEGDIDCPRCDSKLHYEKQVTVEYAVIPVKKAKIINVK
ncbi:hypothetical protein [Clostridium botulinum]|uniref:hypothetical protein n=1 Tax=Clostridium botulinum TaxID=1491 RepID=UPI001C9B0ECC|nr:hypothetical protein [Clostridium botulinum]MBY6842786.1 hypothetical protein [Clostridium botulinum]